MSPQLRLLAGAAAVVVVAGIGAGLISGLRGNGVGSTPTPSPSPIVSAPPSPSASAAAGSVPAALQRRWIGGSRVLPNIDGKAGTTILFKSDSFAFAQSNQGNQDQLHSAATAVGASRIRLATNGSDVSCQVGDSGTYDWSVSPDGTKLTLTAVGESCAARAAAVPGTWLLVACPAQDDFCLGSLPPGRYPSQYIDPFVGPGSVWAPRYNAISYQVPAGWTNSGDWPTQLTLTHGTSPDDTGINVFSDVVAAPSADQCSQDPDSAIGRSARALTDWLGSVDGVVATDPIAVDVGGLSGWRLDVSMDPAWTATCNFSAGKPTRMLFIDSVPGDGLQWGLSMATQMRLYLLDLGDGRTLLVDIEAGSKAQFDAIADEATTIVESFQINR